MGSIRQKQINAIKQMLNLNQPITKLTPSEPVWKVLIYDKTGQDIISPLISVKELRELGVTLFVQLHSDRDPIPEVPAIYFCSPSDENLGRISQDFQKGLYDFYHLNFISPISRQKLEDLASAAIVSNSVANVQKVYDQYVNFISLEDDMCILKHQKSDHMSYYAINKGDIKDTEMDNILDSIVDSLFSVFVTIGSVPIIRSPRGNAAELVSKKLDKKLRENLFDARNNLFHTDTQSGNFNFQRPLLIILDRNIDMATPLHHTWTYQALAHDLLSLSLNRIIIEESTPSGGVRAKNRSCELDSNDKFWATYKGSPFPTVAEAIQEELEQYKTSEEDVKKLKTSMGIDGESDIAMSLVTDNTAKITFAVNSLPQLLEKKRLIDMHTSVATAILNSIKHRKLDTFFELEEKIMSKTQGIEKQVMDLICDPDVGNSEDKLRLFVIFYICASHISESDLCKYENALSEAGCDLYTLKYIKRWKSYTKLTANPNHYEGAGTRTVSMFSKLVSQGSSFVMEGVKNLVVKRHNLPVTRIVDHLMELKNSQEMEEYHYLDPKQLKSTEIPKNRSPFQDAFVFIIGGGNYIEYQNLVDYAKLLFRLEQPHGTGDIYVAWQKGSGNYLATTGLDYMVNLFDRYGQIKDRIRLPGLCSGFEWDTDGDLLGIISQTPQVIIWNANTLKKVTIDVGFKDNPTCLIWAKNLPILSIGTAKGNVSIYDHNSSKRIPVIGKHTKKITCGAWNNDNLLALGSEDKTISISNIEGDTLRVINLRAEPSEVQFSEMKVDDRVSGGQNTVSILVGKKTLYLFNLLDPENPIELAFQQHYGNIIAYRWFGDGYILIGFSSGYFIAISTHIKEVGQELFKVKNHKNKLTDIAVCEKVSKAASCGDNSVKIHDLANLNETSSVLNLTQESGLERIAWSEDGQLLAVCTRTGSLNVYVSYMHLLTSVCIPRIAVLSSLTEVSLYNYDPSKIKLVPIPITLEIEPSFIGIGSYYLAVGMNNRIWFYDLTKPQPGVDDAPLLLRDRQYLGGVTSIKMNSEYAAVFYEGKIQLHLVEQSESHQEDRESIIFPDPHRKDNITCYAITTEFLIIGTDSGDILYFSLEEWSHANEYKHSISLTDLFVDISGTRVIFLDVKSQGYLYNAVSSKVIPIPDLPSKVTGVTWDSNMADRNIFIMFNESIIYTYVYIKYSIYDSCVKMVGQTTLVSKQIPLLMAAGEVLAASVGGQLTQLQLITHDTSLIASNDKNLKTWETYYNKQLALNRFPEAYNSCEVLKSKDLWKKLGEGCMKHLEIELAIRIFKKLEDVAMVCSLKSILEIEDIKLLSGYVSMILGDFDRAQAWFISSSNPHAALEMRRDLLQWEKALELAKKMAPEQIALISREYAQQLEFVGSYSDALLHYEKGLQENLSEEHTYLCKAGIARCCLHCNNLRHGLSIAIELNVKSLQKECAEIMDKKKQLSEAALLYEKCENYDRAAINYIKLRNWSKVGELLPKVSSGKIHLEYAKAKEREGQYQEAAKAYYLAKDLDSVVRLQLEYLNNPEEAVELVQETKSVQGAKLVAKFFQRLNDYNSAIKFLVMSKCNDEAFELARKHGKMELYGEILLNTFSADELKPQDFSSIALHFENERDLLLSGTYWYHAREYHKALKHLLTAARSNSKENTAISTAIDVVATSKSDQLCNNLIEYLLGETDGIPKDPKYLFRLYMAKKQYKEASKSAIIIANEEQINGNYRNAHDVLFGMYQELKNNNIRIPQDMFFNLLLLHSYILVRLHVKRGDHLKGARMLIRVANHISKFPSHIVPILTSTVIECHRAGLRHAAFKYASMLMNPEYRKNIDAKYAKKIEGVVRKPPKNGKNGEPLGDPLEALTPCPYCGDILPETDIFCTNCKLNIPFCIVTGRHIVKDDLTACPECCFPAIRVEFLDILDKEYSSCPMCSEKVDPKRLVKIEDTSPYLNLE